MTFEEPTWKKDVKLSKGVKLFMEVKAYKGDDSAQITVRSQFAKQDRFGGTRIWTPVTKEDCDELIAALMDLSKYAK